MDSGPTDDIHSVAPECNGQSGFERLEPPAPGRTAKISCASLQRFPSERTSRLILSRNATAR
jgi:hypothetical protein